jgi:hypothetical protein
MHRVLGFLLIVRQYPIDFHLRQITACQNQLLLKFVTQLGQVRCGSLLIGLTLPQTIACSFIVGLSRDGRDVRQIQRSKFWFCYGGMYLVLKDGGGICPD